MKSWNNKCEIPASQLDAPPPTYDKEDSKSLQELRKKNAQPLQQKDRDMEISEMAETPQKTCGITAEMRGFMELSRNDLLLFLGIMEGEVQAHEKIIQMLKSEHIRPAALEAHYGSAVPEKVLRALHRDSQLVHPKSFGEDVYEMPMAELDRLEGKHRETYRRMLEQLLLAEKCHRRTVYELENEKRKHADYMNKSDDFTNLLEKERERLKRLLEQEKAYQDRKDKEQSKHLEKVQDELLKLKSFTLMLVDERQLHLEQIDQQNQKVNDLAQQLQQRKEQLSAVSMKAKEDSQRILKLEVDMERKSTKFTQDQEEMTIKLSRLESQNLQLGHKLASMTRRNEELEETNLVFKKSEEELQELREKISKGECGNSSLMAELESLRKRVLEMEGKDEEIIKTESQCRDLRNKLQDEESFSKELKLEVEKLQKRMSELEKLEGAFSSSKSECTQLHTSLEKERGLVKELVSELDGVKNRVKELQISESRLVKAEMGLKDDLAKVKSFTLIIMDERKKMAERIRQEEIKAEDLNKMFMTEQCKVIDVTERLIEESKRLLKQKSEMETKVTGLVKEKEELMSKLLCEEEKCKDLSSRVSFMKARIDHLEDTDKESAKKRVKGELQKLTDSSEQEVIRVKELTLEIERLRNQLKQMEVVEGDLLKTEGDYELLEKKFRTEQDRANILSQQLEEIRTQVARNKEIESGDAVCQEAELHQRCKMEEAKTRDLQADVQALKEKIHELMYKEDQFFQLQVDYSILQQRFMEEEKKKIHLSHEVLNLTKELEVTKRYSRALRSSTNGRRMVDIPLASTGVQTDLVVSDVSENNPALFIKESFQEEKNIMSNFRQRRFKKPSERPSVLDRYPPAACELNMRKSWIPWMRKKGGSLEKSSHLNEESPQIGIMATSQRQGQPLHIRVTPDHRSSSATLEITSPNSDEFFSSATIIPTLGLQKPCITIIPSPTKAGEGAGNLGRAKSPVTITTISRAKSSETHSSDRPLSPISIVTVTTSAKADDSGFQEKQEMTMGQAAFKVTPGKQAAPTPRKHNSKNNMITTEDNKIRIHLGSQFKRPQESDSRPPVITVKPLAVTSRIEEVSTDTILCSPHHGVASRITPGKVMSSITITPITSAPSWSTLSQPGQDAPTSQTSVARIPMSKEHVVHQAKVQPR